MIEIAQIQPSPSLRAGNVFPQGLINLWTPTVSFETPGDLVVGYGNRAGSYFKFGSRVELFFSIVTSSFSYLVGASGDLIITGLPYPSAPGLFVDASNSAPNSLYGTLSWGGITKATYTQISPYVASSSNRASSSIIHFMASGSAVAPVDVVVANVPSGSDVVLEGSLVYFTDVGV